jgi:hypothetical protein
VLEIIVADIPPSNYDAVMYSYPDFGTEFTQQFKVISNFFKDEFDREAE